MKNHYKTKVAYKHFVRDDFKQSLEDAYVFQLADFLTLTQATRRSKEWKTAYTVF